MPDPQVKEHVKDVPARGLRAIFAGIGSLLGVSDKIRNKPAATVPVPETTGNVTVVAPPTASETVAPETVAPETVAPETVAPETVAPETVAPETVAPETVAPETVAPETVAPETVAPETVAPETVAPETVAPETVAPETVAPETVAPETVAPETVAPETVAPETVAPETVAPEDSVTTGQSGALPLANYDELSVASLRARLRNLSSEQLSQLIEYEKSHQGRAEVITMFERRVAKLAAEA
jgi:hypothetical protein